VPAMKLTPNAAMRARDVSRPRAEHLAEAETAEASIAGGVRARSRDAGKGSTGREGAGRPEREGADTNGAARGTGGTGGTGDERAGRPGFPRRRGPRDGTRRGRSSR
jgi:hypothetical protein